MSNIRDTLDVGGLTVREQQAWITASNISANAAIARSQIAQEPLAVFPVPMTIWRVHDALHTNLPGTPANDDLALIGGTFGTGSPSIQTGDLKAAGATSRYARAIIVIPECYEAAETISLRFRGFMTTTIADVAATLDVQAFKSDREAGVDGADLYTGSAADINSLTPAYQTFSLTPTDLDPGDWLDVRITVLVNDGATATAVTGVIGSVDLLCDIRA